MHFHCDRGYEAHAAVNVKIHADWFSPEAAAEFPGLTWEWVESTLTEREREEWWQAACEDGWERAQEAAREAFGSKYMHAIADVVELSELKYFILILWRHTSNTQ